MKKNLIRLTACALGAMCVLTFAACSGDKPSSSAASTASDPQSSAAVSSAAQSSQAAESQPASSAAAGGLNANGKFDTVEDFVNSDLMQTQLDSMKSSLDDDTMSIELTGEGNKLIYTFTYKDLEGVDAATLGPALESSLENMASTFESIASSLKSAVEVDDPVVVVTYLGPDGEELCSKEFTPAE